MSSDAFPLSAREQRVRRLANRRGLMLHKWRSRNPQDWLWSTYYVVEQEHHCLASGLGLDIDDAEAFCRAW